MIISSNRILILLSQTELQVIASLMHLMQTAVQVPPILLPASGLTTFLQQPDLPSTFS